MLEKTIKVRSITNVKHSGEWHLPGTTWDCPTSDVQTLYESGSIEQAPDQDRQEDILLPVSEMKKKEIINELITRRAIFEKSEGIDTLRDVLSMARESQAN